jgi:hypothetical protein
MGKVEVLVTASPVAEALVSLSFMGTPVGGVDRPCRGDGALWAALLLL